MCLLVDMQRDTVRKLGAVGISRNHRELHSSRKRERGDEGYSAECSDNKDESCRQFVFFSFLNKREDCWTFKAAPPSSSSSLPLTALLSFSLFHSLGGMHYFL